MVPGVSETLQQKRGEVKITKDLLRPEIGSTLANSNPTNCFYRGK